MTKIFFLFMLFNVFCANAQNVTTGYVMDSQTHEILIGANVIDTSANQGVFTNQYGYFSIQINSDAALLNVSHLGYATTTISTNGNEHITVLMNRQELHIDEIVVHSRRRTSDIGMNTISSVEIKNIPSPTGETDLLRVVQLLPGVKSGFEGNSNLFVRGGTHDQNLILLDDVVLYNVTHFGNIISVFNTDAINDVTLIKGAFPSRYGGRLSSVLDVRMRDGNKEKIQGSIGIGLLSTKGMLEGPIEKHKSSYMFSFRHNTFPIFKLFFDNGLSYRYYDANIKLNRKMSERDYLYISFYAGRDKMTLGTEKGLMSQYQNEMFWGNVSGAVRWNHRLSQKLFVNTIAAYTNYFYNTQLDAKTTQPESVTRHDFKSAIRDLSVKSNIDFHVSNANKIQFGGGVINHHFTPGRSNIFQTNSSVVKTDTVIAYQNTQAIKTFLYAENQLKTGIIGFNAGVRFSNFSTQKKNHFSIEPRISGNITLWKRTILSAAFTAMTQHIHLLGYSGVGLPSDFFVSSDARVAPQKSRQYSFNITDPIFAGFELTFEGYYKTMINLIAFKPGTDFGVSSGLWQDKIETDGTGIAKGIEIMLRKTSGTLTGWVNATFSQSERKFANLNNGEFFPCKYDRRVEFNFLVLYAFSEKFSFSATWVFGSGSPVTLPSLAYASLEDNAVIFSYEGVNTSRMRSYHRLDVGLLYKSETKRGKLNEWNFSIINVYNRKNPYYYYMQRSHGENAYKLYQQSLFGFFPSVSYTFRF